MSTFKKEKVSELIRHQAATFIETNSNRTSLITITRVIISHNLKSAIILLTVLPEDKAADVLNFLIRQRRDFRTYLKKHVRMKSIPSIDFQIDEGEKNRIRIEELLGEEK